MKFLTFLILFSSINMMAETPFEKAEKLFKQEKYEQAKVYFQDYIDNAKNTDAVYYKSIEYLGDIAGHQKKWDEAIKQYTILKNQFPSSANYMYKFGGALGMKAKSVNKFKALSMISDVENAFLKASKLDSKHIESRWALVMLYIELPGIVGGSETKAQKYADELKNISKVDGYLADGYIDEYFKRYKKAEASYIKAHEIGNSKTTFQKLYNLYLKKLKNKDKANQLKEQFEK
jgi:tetratricopeptide (TPR) repeat protein